MCPPTKLNPADEVSRGVQANKFVKNSKWLSGPDFLRLPTKEWPNQQALPEEESTIVSNVTTTKIASASEFGHDCMICYYSSFERLKRGVAWIMKFGRFLLCKVRLSIAPESRHLTAEDLDHVEKRLILNEQRRC